MDLNENLTNSIKYVDLHYKNMILDLTLILKLAYDFILILCYFN